MTTTPEREAEPISAEGLARVRKSVVKAEEEGLVEEYHRDVVLGLIALIDAQNRIIGEMTMARLAARVQHDMQRDEIAMLRAREAEFVRFEVGDIRNG